LGAHCTDDERLLRCLLKNRQVLANQGIAVPGPTKYRTLFREMAGASKGLPASAEIQAMVLDQIMKGSSAERLILSWDNFLSFTPRALEGGLYRAAGERVRALALVFPQSTVEFCLALRNPATFLPELFNRQRNVKGGTKNFATFFKHWDPHDIRWSDVVDRILGLNPGVNLTIWCDEDTPLIWPEVLQAVSGHAAQTVLDGTDELLADIMSADGLSRLRAYLGSHSVSNPVLRRKITTAFLDRFALQDRITMDVEVPDWTADLVDSLTRNYELDVADIRSKPGVRLIEP